MKDPALQRRHFEFIADVISRMPDDKVKKKTATHFGVRLLSTNPQFDFDRFLKACCPEE